MNGKQLKNSILQLAIQGKLVAQDANDEPASELLKRIRAEKERLVKEGKLKKKDLVTAPISDEEKPFEVPEGWEWCRLGEIAFVTKLAGFEYTKYITDNLTSSNGVPLFKGKNVQSGEIIYDFEAYIPETISNELSRSQITKPCLLTPYVGTIGNIGYHNKKGKFHLGSNVGKIEFYCPNEYLDLVNRFILLFLRSKSGLAELSKFKKATAQESISIQAIREVLLPLPPLAEQQRIVAKIEELMPLVEEYDKAQTKLDDLNGKLPEALKKSILQEAIMGKLVPQDTNDEPASELLKRIRAEKERLVKEGKLKKKDLVTTTISDEEKPFEVPEGWEWCRLEDILEFVNGRAYKREELLSTGKYKVLRVGNFFTNESWYYSNLELEDSKYCYKGDLLYAWSASFGPHIWEGEKTIFHYHIWNVKYSKKNLFRDYLYYFLLNDVNVIKKSTTGSTMIHVSMENMKPRLIPLPPLAEQHRIVAKIEELMQEIDKLR